MALYANETFGTINLKTMTFAHVDILTPYPQNYISLELICIPAASHGAIIHSMYSQGFQTTTTATLDVYSLGRGWIGQ